MFELLERPAGDTDILRSIINFRDFGHRTEPATIRGLPYFVNEFWTSGQRKSHSIHEISYRACFKAQLPRFFISRLSGPGDAVYDPFMGRGTTPVEANLLGRRALGNDINPLSVLLTRPRLSSISLDDVEDRLSSIAWGAGAVSRSDLLAFYHPKTLRAIEALRAWLGARGPDDPVAGWIGMVALNRLTGHSSGFFSGRTMPPNQAVTVEAQTRINDRLGQAPPERDLAGIILKKTRTLLRDGPPPTAVAPVLSVCDAAVTPHIADGSVALVVTSPPFLDIVQYAADNWLRCWFASIDPGSVPMSIHRTEAQWQDMVRAVLREQARVLRPGGHVAFEVGEVRSGKVLLEELVWRAADGLPFYRLGIMVNDQRFTKTANCWGVSNGSKGTNTNRIVLLRRH
jgi:hypothetical protein